MADVELASFLKTAGPLHRRTQSQSPVVGASIDKEISQYLECHKHDFEPRKSKSKSRPTAPAPPAESASSIESVLALMMGGSASPKPTVSSPASNASHQAQNRALATALQQGKASTTFAPLKAPQKLGIWDN